MMKYIFYIVMSVITLGSFFLNDFVYGAGNKKRQASIGKPSVKRAASSSSSNKGGSASSSGASKNSKSGKNNTSSKKSSSSKSSSSNETKESSVVKCLQEKMPEILDGACSFLFDSDIKEALNDDDNLYCVYNYKDSGKVSSIYSYYLGAYYGITENAVKADTSIINVRDKSKNALKYYEYLIDEISKGTLKESKILDNVTTEVLKKADLKFDEESIIENKNIDMVPISIDIVSGDIESCTKLTKAAMTSCGAIGDVDAKSKITESCTAYNSALIKLAGAKKAEALGYDTEIIKVLKQRINADFYDYKDMVNMEKEKLELEKEYSDITKEKAFFDNQSKREETASKILTLQEEINNTADDEIKKTKQEQLDNLKKTICNYEKLLKNYDKDYEAPDDLSKDCN